VFGRRGEALVKPKDIKADGNSSGKRSVYIYKMTNDDGGAPCVWNGTLSLAICKPAIRSSAPEGSIILGFAANSLDPNNPLIYAAKVTARLERDEYFTAPRFEGRPDRVYEWSNGRFSWRLGAKFHSSQTLRHDLGNPPAYRRAIVLISEGTKKFRYFRCDCPLDYKSQFPELKQLIENLSQGHRVNLSSELRSEVDLLVKQVFRMRSIHSVTPVPVASCGHSCSRADDAFRVVEC
jgi:hypothetical protein